MVPNSLWMYISTGILVVLLWVFLLSLSYHLSFSVFSKYVGESPKYWDCPCLGGMCDVIEKTVFLYRNAEIFKREHNQILNHVALIVNAVWHWRRIFSTLEFKRDWTAPTIWMQAKQKDVADGVTNLSECICFLY